ncbi:MAG: hybrid sensor histidine kinase/response regulator [Deltaproteobacteria bacterium]|nr:hybrid sensor histidine kinase/response regulator [Deltaproteobacteria bacterium]
MTRDDSRLDAILAVLISYARQDFSTRVAVSERRDEIDAIATGINILAEELDGEVASRRELESAYARLQTTQAQLLVAEKFAAVGQLANGVAHELNNPATWVLLGITTARRRVANACNLTGEALAHELAAAEQVLSDVHAGMERIRTVIGDLRALSRVDAATPVELDLEDVIRSACQLARPAYLSVARLVLDLGGVPSIRGDRGRLGQLVTNLIVNAAYAVAEEAAQHEIVISTRVDGEHVLLAVEDSGPGIPDELFERVFEPYFTTKPSEVGTGLGLALVRKIAERHGGTARATRGTRRGARIEVRLPRAGPRTCSAVEPCPVSTTPVSGTATRRARVLLIDDEPMLLGALVDSIGGDHDLVTALGGEAAREVLARDRAFDLVLCDLQMPNVDGVAIHDALAKDVPELLSRLIMMTGGAVTPRAAQFLEKVQPRIVGKPVDIDGLLALVRDAAARRP